MFFFVRWRCNQCFDLIPGVRRLKLFIIFFYYFFYYFLIQLNDYGGGVRITVSSLIQLLNILVIFYSTK